MAILDIVTNANVLSRTELIIVAFVNRVSYGWTTIGKTFFYKKTYFDYLINTYQT
jgi:hypothetical protein